MTMLQLRGPIGSCVLPWWLFIAVDTLCQHPMGTGHMTVLQSCGLMEFRVLQWCHPMLASTRRTSCCTRIITLYGTLKWIQARTMTSLSESQILQFPLLVKFQNLKHEESFKWLCFRQKGALSFFSRESGSESATTFQNEANKLYPHKNYVMEKCIFVVCTQTVSGLS